MRTRIEELEAQLQVLREERENLNRQIDELEIELEEKKGYQSLNDRGIEW